MSGQTESGTIRIGLVGCGFIGAAHSWCIRSLVRAGLVDARLTHTLDLDPGRAARLARGHRGEVAEDLDHLLDNVDAVWVCTWTAAHREAVRAAAGRGRAVFCEKPLAPDLQSASEVAETLKTVPHQVGLVLRYAPVFVALRERLASGIDGRVMAVVFRDDQYFPDQGAYGSTWRADRRLAGGGTLIEHSIHDLDLLRWMLGDAVEVRANTAGTPGIEGIEDTAVVTVRHASGAVSTLTSVWHQVLSRGSTRRVEVICEKAVLWTEDDYLGPLHVHTSDGLETVPSAPPEWVGRLDVPAHLGRVTGEYAVPTKAFLDSLSTGGGTARGYPQAADALAAHGLVDAAYRSAAAGGDRVAVTP